MELGRAPFAIGEKNLATVVMHLRIANCAGLIVDECGYFAGGDVEFAEATFRTIEFVAIPLIAEIGIPVTIMGKRSLGKDDFLDAMPGEGLRS